MVTGAAGDTGGRPGGPRGTTWWWHPPRGRFVLQIVVALLAGCVAFVVAAVVSTAARDRVPPVVLGIFFLAAVFAVARLAGIMYGLPVGVVVILAYDWYFLPPLRVLDASTVLLLVLFLVMSVIVGSVTIEAGRRTVAAEMAKGDLADEQAALRRVATLVARGGSPDRVFPAVADELGRLVGAEATLVARLDDGPAGVEGGVAATVVGCYGTLAEEITAGSRLQFRPGLAAATSLALGSTVRMVIDPTTKAPYGHIARKLGLRAAVATPVVVSGRQWGVTIASTSQDDLPPGTESRMTDFMELAAIAVANAQSEEDLRDLADTQASLRRLAMLVAAAEPPEALFAAVVQEVSRHFGNDTARMIRFEADGTATLIASEGTTGPHVQIGKPWKRYPPTGLTATVQQTGQPARVDDYRKIPGGEPFVREGLIGAVAMPVNVDGRLWGLIAIGSTDGALPADTEQRLTDFTNLVATAVANAQGRAELMTSRARLVAAADEVRRRIERDLHDGAQQRLVSLALGLRSAATEPSASEEVRTEVEQIAGELVEVIEELRETSRGIHPAILSESGLRPALRALVRRSAIPVELDAAIDGRLPEPVEVAAYYVVSEMLTNATKHAKATLVEVKAEVTEGRLWLSVRDDGVGGADPMLGSGLVGLKDRLDALGGTFSVHSPPGRGTTVSCELPLAVPDNA